MPEFGEPQIRLGVFIGLFLLLAILEFLAPRRKLKYSKPRRWLTNWAIVVIDSAIVRLVFASAAVGGAIWAEANQFGLFNTFGIGHWLAVAVSFVILDFAIWLAHVASHKIPVLWRVHRMHHSDVDFDVTTAIRFHPIEIVLSMMWKLLVVILLGAPYQAVLLFEIALNGCAMFNHSNLRIPKNLDRFVRLLIVTPDMHRVHHSIINRETDSNYGFNLSVWDRLFGTYVDQPRDGHDKMTIGLSAWQDERPTRLIWTLKIPFINGR